MKEHKKIITVEIDNLESIKSGLLQYISLVATETALKDEEFYSTIDFKFVKEDESELTEDLIKEKLLIDALNNYKGYAEGYCETEDIFFAIALQYEQLKDEIIEASKEIVNFARKKNDTSDLWCDEFHVLGLGVLYLVAHKYPEYSYLMGAYMIPYWDDEHAPYAQELIQNYCLDRGFTKEVFKIFAYCDNFSVRANMFPAKSYFNYETGKTEIDEKVVTVKQYFNENREIYEWFKNCLKKRFLEYDYIQRTESEYEEHPIDQFYKSFLADGWEDVSDEFNDIFVYKEADLEASELEKEIINFIGKPLTTEPVDEYEELNYYHQGRAIEYWKEFITDYFDDGLNIWNYIENGGHRSILDNIKTMDSKEFVNIFEIKDYKLSKVVFYNCNKYSFVPDELERIAMDLFYDYHDEDFNINIKTVETDKDGNSKLVRFVDFLYAIFDKDLLKSDFVHFITDTYELLDIEEFNKRYALDIFEHFINLSKKNSSIFLSVYKDELNELYEQLCKIRNRDIDRCEEVIKTSLNLSETKEDTTNLTLNEIVDKYDENNEPFIMIEHMAFYIYQDMLNNRSDKVTDLFCKYISNNLMHQVVNIFNNEIDSEKNTDLKKELIEFFNSKPQIPPQELIMKLMKGGEKSLTKDELELLHNLKNSQKKSVDLEKTLSILLNKKTHDLSDYIEYSIFSDDYFPKILQTIFLLSLAQYSSFNKLPIEGFDKLDKLLKTFIKLSPTDTINKISKVAIDKKEDGFRKKKNFGKSMNKSEFLERLIYLKINEVDIAAWEIFKALDNRDKDDISRIVDILGDIDEEYEKTMFGSSQKRKRENYEKALNYLLPDVKIKLLQQVRDRYRLDDQLNQTLDAVTKKYIKKLLMSQSQVILVDNDFDDSIRYELFNYTENHFSNLTYEGVLTDEEINKKIEKLHWNKNPTIILEKQNNNYKIHGDDYLIRVINHPDNFKPYNHERGNIIITDKELSDYPKYDDIYRLIISYMDGDIELQNLKKYDKYLIPNYPSIDNMKFEDLLNALDQEKADSLLKLYISIGVDMGQIISYASKNLEQYIHYVNIVKDLNGETQDLVYRTIRDMDDEYIIALDQRISVSKYIKSKSLDDKLKLLEDLVEREKLIYIIKDFKDDKSRQVKNLVSKYIDFKDKTEDSDEYFEDYYEESTSNPMDNRIMKVTTISEDNNNNFDKKENMQLTHSEDVEIELINKGFNALNIEFYLDIKSETKKKINITIVHPHMNFDYYEHDFSIYDDVNLDMTISSFTLEIDGPTKHLIKFPYGAKGSYQLNISSSEVLIYQDELYIENGQRQEIKVFEEGTFIDGKFTDFDKSDNPFGIRFAVTNGKAYGKIFHPKMNKTIFNGNIIETNLSKINYNNSGEYKILFNPAEWNNFEKDLYIFKIFDENQKNVLYSQTFDFRDDKKTIAARIKRLLGFEKSSEETSWVLHSGVYGFANDYKPGINLNLIQPKANREISVGSYIGCSYILNDNIFKDKDEISIKLTATVYNNGHIIHEDSWNNIAYKNRLNGICYYIDKGEDFRGDWHFKVIYKGKEILDYIVPIKVKE